MQTTRHFAYLGLVAALALTGCEKQQPGATSPATNASSQSSPLTAPVDYLGAVGKAQQTAIKSIDLSTLRHAIDMYKIEEGKNPATLEELVTEKHLPRLPALPTGMKYKYDPASGSVSVIKP